jgi:YbbR domain-containing protein
VLSSQIDQINNKRLGSQPVTSFSPDTLYFDFSNRKVKRIPVNLITAIKYRHQFFQSGPVMLNPGYVIINGPAAVIDKISYWDSDTLKTDSVDEPINTRLAMRPVTEGNLSVYPRNIQVNVPVEEFTEKQIEIPVKLINNVAYQDVKVFPLKVKVTFTVALSKYEQTDDDFFEASADLDLWRLHNYKVLPVSITKLPDYCKVVRIEPRTIDFIVKK